MSADDITTAASPDGSEDYAGYRNPPQYGKVPSVGCAVLHQDEMGNTTPCPGYPLCSKALDGPAEPLPQPECSSCHNFGPGLVQDAVRRLQRDILMNGTKAPRMHDINIILNALGLHHAH